PDQPGHGRHLSAAGEEAARALAAGQRSTPLRAIARAYSVSAISLSQMAPIMTMPAVVKVPPAGGSIACQTVVKISPASETRNRGYAWRRRSSSASEASSAPHTPTAQAATISGGNDMNQATCSAEN